MPAPVDPSAFRRVMSRWPTGVAIVTACEGGRDVGLTVNALLSVSLEPPTILISLSEIADTTPVIGRTGVFGVSFLSSGQRELSERFARAIAPVEKFRGVELVRGSLGLALIHGATATLECRVGREVQALDHRLFLGEVTTLSVGEDDTPLVFHRSGYADASGERGLTLPPAVPRHV